jgi:hypothetical protein
MIVYKSPEEIGKMRRAGRIVAGTIERVLAAVRPNVTTAALDAVAEEYIREQGATPSSRLQGRRPARDGSRSASIARRSTTRSARDPSAERRSTGRPKLDFSHLGGVPRNSAVTVHRQGAAAEPTSSCR